MRGKVKVLGGGGAYEISGEGLSEGQTISIEGRGEYVVGAELGEGWRELRAKAARGEEVPQLLKDMFGGIFGL